MSILSRLFPKTQAEGGADAQKADEESNAAKSPPKFDEGRNGVTGPFVPARPVAPALALPLTAPARSPTTPVGSVANAASIARPPRAVPAREPIEVRAAVPRAPTPIAVPVPQARPMVAPAPPSASPVPPVKAAAVNAAVVARTSTALPAPRSLQGSPKTSPTPVLTNDLSEVQALFGKLAANHVRPVRDFMIELKWGHASRQWLSVCEPAVTSLHGAAEKLELTGLSGALARFGAALRSAAGTAGALDDAQRQEIVTRYEALVRLMPEAFSLDAEGSQRETAIVTCLLLQVPGMQKWVIDRLSRVGLSGFGTLFLAKAEDVAATAGIDEELAWRIVDKVQEHRLEVQTRVVDTARAHERKRVEALLGQLSRQHAEFEAVSAMWSPEAMQRKNEVRRERELTLLEINVMLACLGEVSRMREIERLPFERKLVMLRSFLSEAGSQYAAM